MHMAVLRIHADVRPDLEVPPVPFARLMHLRVARAASVFARRRRVDDRRIHNRASQIVVYRVHHGPAQLMPLQQMAEVQEGRLVWRRRRTAQIRACKPSQRC